MRYRNATYAQFEDLNGSMVTVKRPGAGLHLYRAGLLGPGGVARSTKESDVWITVITPDSDPLAPILDRSMAVKLVFALLCYLFDWSAR